jgi:UDP-N-acetylmuramoyl-tripeptide--D-alanyl-D-alanine ligase
LGRAGTVYRREFDLPVVAVGGSNGKTTTKELIASVLSQKHAALWSEASFNNDIGVPLTLLRLERAHQVGILEAGTNHPGELPPLLKMMSPRFGVVTNIAREHLEFFHDLVGVAREEGAVAECLPSDGVLFLNGDNPWSEIIARRTHARVVLVGLDRSNDCAAREVRMDENGSAFIVECRYPGLQGEYRTRLLGRHQVINALLAIAVGAEMGLSREEIQRGLLACAAVKMRLQMSNPGGILVLDDSYNANADSMLAALQTLRELPCAGRRVAVLGDMAEQGDCSRAAHFEVGRRAATARLDQLFTIGRRGCEIAAAARDRGLKSVIEIAEVEPAAQVVKAFARPGDMVLVKASRSMRFERITEVLRGSCLNHHE